MSSPAAAANTDSQARPARRRVSIACACLGAAAILTLGACATTNTMRQAQAAEVAKDFDLAVAHYARLVRAEPDNRDARVGLDRAKLRAAEHHLGLGRRLFSQGRYDDAVDELQLAFELSPTSTEIDNDLRAARAAQRAKLAAPEGGQTALESVLERTRNLPPLGFELPEVDLPATIDTGAQSTSRQVYMMLGQLAGLSLVFDPQFREEPVTVSLKEPTLQQALNAVAQNSRTFYKMTAPKTLTIIPDNPAKRREYTEENIRTFFVSNLDTKEVIDLLRVVADVRQIQAVSTNTISIRDTPERLDAVSKLLTAIDKAKAEVIVNVEILEVDRTRLRDYGLQPASPGASGLDGAIGTDAAQQQTLRSLRNLTQADILVSGVPALYYRLLKTDTSTRTLANPHIRIIDGTVATANLGDEVPVPTSQIVGLGQAGAVPQAVQQIQYRTIGVNLDITPRFHANNEVTLALKISLSTLAGTGFAGYPAFGNREISTTLRLRDGETNIIAGLIREDERTRAEGIPGLSDLPIVGRLFGRNRRESEETDIILTLTPHIVRVLELTEADLRPFRIQNEGSGALPVELAPIAAPPRDVVIKK